MTTRGKRRGFAWRSPFRLVRGLRDRLDVRDDGVDLGRLEVMLEAGHARRAVRDEAAQRELLPAERGAGQLGRVLRARHLRLGVAGAARLVEEPHALQRE